MGKSIEKNMNGGWDFFIKTGYPADDLHPRSRAPRAPPCQCKRGSALPPASAGDHQSDCGQPSQRWNSWKRLAGYWVNKYVNICKYHQRNLLEIYVLRIFKASLWGVLTNGTVDWSRIEKKSGPQMDWFILRIGKKCKLLFNMLEP